MITLNSLIASFWKSNYFRLKIVNQLGNALLQVNRAFLGCRGRPMTTTKRLALIAAGYAVAGG